MTLFGKRNSKQLRPKPSPPRGFALGSSVLPNVVVTEVTV